MARHGGRAASRARASLTAVALLVAWRALGAAPVDRQPLPNTPVAGLRLPADAVYQRTVGPDSAVVFSHATHVALADNKCTGCHPRPFRMLSPIRHVSHREMNSGGSCGTCHDGEHAFGVRDRQACASCHSGMPSAKLAAKDSLAGRPSVAPRRIPKPVVYVRGEASPGQVTFRHATHLGAETTCVACHPKPFAMKSSRARPAGAMHEPSACGMCHDGSRAFGVEDAEACARCHAAGVAR